jgi:hypothetical protein
MAATTSEKNRLRRVFEGLGIEVPSSDFDTLVDEVYADLEADYPAIANDERYVRAKLDIGESLQVQATKLVDYDQNTQGEKLSVIFKNLTTLMNQWRSDLKGIIDAVLATSKNGVHFGDFDAPLPPTWRDYPNA